MKGSMALKSPDIPGSSDRTFGLLFASVFAMIGLWPLLRAGHARPIPLAIAIGFLASTMLRPALLHPLNKAWTALGLLLGRIVNPVITAILFFLVITPTGLISRLFGRDPLRLKAAPQSESYWILRNPPGPDPDTMSKQY